MSNGILEAEQQRQLAENARVIAEEARIIAESARQQAEELRRDCDESRAVVDRLEKSLTEQGAVLVSMQLSIQELRDRGDTDWR